MKLEQLFASVLQEPVDRFDDRTSPEVMATWDSLRHIELVLTVEATYGVQFSTTEVATFRTLGCVREALQHKGVAA